MTFPGKIDEPLHPLEISLLGPVAIVKALYRLARQVEKARTRSLNLQYPCVVRRHAHPHLLLICVGFLPGVTYEYAIGMTGWLRLRYSLALVRLVSTNLVT